MGLSDSDIVVEQACKIIGALQTACGNLQTGVVTINSL